MQFSFVVVGCAVSVWHPHNRVAKVCNFSNTCKWHGQTFGDLTILQLCSEGCSMVLFRLYLCIPMFIYAVLRHSFCLEYGRFIDYMEIVVL